MWINGTIRGGYSSSSWQNLIVSEMSVESPLEINITGSYNSATRVGEANIQIIATAPITYTNLKLRLAVTESNIGWSAPNGSYWHHQTFRDMRPYTSGTSFTINEGDTLEFSQYFNCPSPLNQDNCELVVFVQSDTDKRILQGAKIDVMALNYNLLPFSLISPINNSISPTCWPVFNWHPSDDPDSGYAIVYEVQVSDNQTFTSPLSSDPISDTSWQVPVCLYNDSTYYWRVKASNGHATDIYSDEVFSFVIDEGEVTVYPEILSDIELSLDDSINIDLVVFNDSYISISFALSDFGGLISFEYDAGMLDSMAADTISIFISSIGLEPDDYSDTIIVETTHFIDNLIKIPASISVRDNYAYLPGDVNMSGGAWPPTATGPDVTYLVNFFRGGPTSQSCLLDNFWCSADANGDCNVVGADVTKLVNVFRGQGSIGYCPDYEPAWFTPDDLPAEMPPGWPGCE